MRVIDAIKYDRYRGKALNTYDKEEWLGWLLVVGRRDSASSVFVYRDLIHNAISVDEAIKRLEES